MIKEQILELIKEADPANPLAYVQDIVADFAKEKLDKQILACEDCINCMALPKSITRGDPRAAILVIGESPTAEQAGDPNEFMVTPLENTEGGDMLQTVFEHFSVNPDEVFYINAVNCFPYKDVGSGRLETRTPRESEVKNCRVFVEYAIDLVKPVAILLLGSVATNMFHKSAISQARGQWIDIKGIPAMPTYHPDFFIHIQGQRDEEVIDMLKDDFVEDIRVLLEYVNEKYPDNNIFLDEPVFQFIEIETGAA